MKEQCNLFFLAELINSKEHLETLQKIVGDKHGIIDNAISCFNHLIENLMNTDISKYNVLTDCINYCHESYAKIEQKTVSGQVQNTSPVDVSVNSDSDVIEDIKLPNADVPYNEKGYFNFTVTYDKEYETDKAFALLFKYAGKEYIHYHAKMYPIKFDKLGIKCDSTLEYKIFRIDRQNKKKIKCRTLSAKEFAVLVLSSEQK
jgi:hypothetical protein